MKPSSRPEPNPSPEDTQTAFQDAVEAKKKAIALRREQYQKKKNRTWVEFQKLKPLSESIIWQLQTEYYSEKGPDAWRNKTIPHYITSNSYIARAYARVALAWLQDLALQGFAGKAHLIELGAGTGQFSFLFLQHLESLLGQTALPTAEFRYIMSDISPSNIQFWKHHPAFEDFSSRGILHFASFDPTQERTLQLNGDCLEPIGQEQPVFAIANYFFDSIPVDAFEISEGQLQECQARILLPEDTDITSAEEIIQNLKIEYQGKPVQMPYYSQEDRENCLRDSAEEINKGSLLFPTAGLQCLENLLKLAGNHLFILTADKGSIFPEELEGLHLPQLTRHGSFSHHVNFSSMEHWARGNGGEAWYSPDPSINIQVCAFAWAGGIAHMPLTWEAFREAIVAFGPDEFFQLKRDIENQFAGMSTDGILSYLSLAQWDPKAMKRSLKHLEPRLEEGDDDQIEQARRAALRSAGQMFSLDLQEEE